MTKPLKIAWNFTISWLCLRRCPASFSTRDTCIRSLSASSWPPDVYTAGYSNVCMATALWRCFDVARMRSTCGGPKLPFACNNNNNVSRCISLAVAVPQHAFHTRPRGRGGGFTCERQRCSAARGVRGVASPGNFVRLIVGFSRALFLYSRPHSTSQAFHLFRLKVYRNRKKVLSKSVTKI